MPAECKFDNFKFFAQVLKELQYGMMRIQKWWSWTMGSWQQLLALL